MKKTLEEYELEGKIKEQTDKERERSDREYAQKRIETVVDGAVKVLKHFLSVVAIGILGLLGKIIIEYLKTK